MLCIFYTDPYAPSSNYRFYESPCLATPETDVSPFRVDMPWLTHVFASSRKYIARDGMRLESFSAFPRFGAEGDEIGCDFLYIRLTETRIENYGNLEGIFDITMIKYKQEARYK